MRKRIEWEWEKLDESTYRAKTIGGWMVLHSNHTTISDGKKKEMVQTESMCFVADRDHEWHILPKMKEEVKVAKNLAGDFDPK